MASQISREDARQALGDIESTMLQARHYAAAAASPILYLWGVVWTLAYSLCQFYPQWGGAFWAVLGTCGGVLTAIITKRAPVRDSESDARFGYSWILLFGFGGVWFAILLPWEQMKGFEYMELHRAIGAYGATLAMFAYVMMGLWWDRFFMWLGLAITALTIVGYFLFPAYFNLWMAVFGGGLLLVSGMLIKRRWKQVG